MTQVNVLEAKTNLSKLLHMLEAGEEDQIIISRNGKPVAQLTRMPKPERKSIIGIAKDDPDCVWPEDIHYLDDEIAEMFYGDL